MTRIASVVLTTLSLFLGMFFFFIGLIKLSPSLNREIHREIRRSFIRYAKVVPIFKQLGWKVNASLYRQIVGYSEIAAGLALAFFPDTIKLYVSLFLMCITLGAVYTHIKVDDELDKMYPAIAFTVMLACRILLYALLRRSRAQEMQLRAKQAELADLQEKVARAKAEVEAAEEEMELRSAASSDGGSVGAATSKQQSKKARRRSKKKADRSAGGEH